MWQFGNSAIKKLSTSNFKVELIHCQINSLPNCQINSLTNYFVCFDVLIIFVIIFLIGSKSVSR